MADQTPESKKDEFRKYLERSGVIDALTKVLVALYEEPDKPANALDFVKNYLSTPQDVDVDQLVKDNTELKTQVDSLQAEVEALKKKLEEEEETESP